MEYQISMNENTLIPEKTSTGFSAFAERYPLFTTGRTIPESIGNAPEATNLYFEDQQLTFTQGNLRFEIDFKQFFQYHRV